MSAVVERLDDHLHPRLAALRDNPGGEAEFWAEIARDRAPLIESDQTPGYSIVTYVFAMPEGASHVVVNPGFGNARDNVMGRPIQRRALPGTGRLRRRGSAVADADPAHARQPARRRAHQAPRGRLHRQR